MKLFIEKHIHWLLLSSLFIFFSVIILFLDWTYGGSDSYLHHQIARFSWQHPELLLHHWGKPLYTLLSSPFAQLGMKGSRFFNLLLTLTTALVSYQVYKKYFSGINAWIVILFIFFSPMYFIVCHSPLTEILFGFILIFGIYMFIEKKYFVSLLLISFLPFVRSEGFIVLPVFGALLLLLKQYKYIPLLIAGTIIYSIIGGLYYKDFFWLIHRNPYQNASDIYGHGDIIHFFDAYKEIIGLPLAILFFRGAIYLLFNKIRINKTTIINKQNENSIIKIFLLLILPVLYFSFHVILWWKGWGGSLGLTRVMTPILPLTALISLKGFNQLDQSISKYSKWAQKLFQYGMLVWVMILPVKQWGITYDFDEREKIVKETANWISENNHQNSKIFYYDPMIVYFLSIDPFNDQTSSQCYNNPTSIMKTGELLIWDLHFGPNEGYTNLDSLTMSSNLKQLFLKKEERENTLNNSLSFETRIFMKN